MSPHATCKPKTPFPAKVVLVRTAIAGVTLFAFWFVGLIWFVTPPVTENRPTITDAIVVLTGGSLRLQSGIKLLLELGRDTMPDAER